MENMATLRAVGKHRKSGKQMLFNREDSFYNRLIAGRFRTMPDIGHLEKVIITEDFIRQFLHNVQWK